MMRQTGAILLDAYRELNAKKLFWIVLAMSGLVVVVFAFFGINDTGLTFGPWSFQLFDLNTTLISKELFYKSTFLSLGVTLWLRWIATGIAIISTASLIPDFVASGSIELSLSKPLSRLRLFLTKYLAGLLFVFLQASVFSVLAFFVLGIRGGAWMPSVFLIIPIVTLFFSYLFSISVLVGLVTRSAIAALLVTGVLWGIIFVVQLSEVALLAGKNEVGFQVTEGVAQIERVDTRLTVIRAEIDEAIAKNEREPSERAQKKIDKKRENLEDGEIFLAGVREQTESMQDSLPTLERFHTISWWIKAPLPKTGETLALLERWMIEMEEIPVQDRQGSFGRPPEDDRTRAFVSTLNTDNSSTSVNPDREFAEALRGRSLFWVLGTSLIFEGVLLGLAAFIFVRRDF